MLTEYRAVESAVPAKAIALNVSMDSFLFHDSDHKRFLLDDWPGAAGPPPGWPLTQGPEAVTEYLSRNSVRYVVYGYQYANWSAMKACQFFPNVAHFSEADETLELLSLVTLHQFDQIRALHKTIYDDGKIAVIDLESPASTHAAMEPDWTLSTSTARMCTAVAQRYIAAHPSDVLPHGPLSNQR